MTTNDDAGVPMSGYDSAHPPRVILPPPEAGTNYTSAEGRAILKSTGRLLRVDVVDGGSGYTKPPTITVSQQGCETPALAQAKMATGMEDGKGVVEAIRLVDPGSGYDDSRPVAIEVSRPDSSDGRIAVLRPVLDMAVEGIEITRGGTGYAVERPLKVLVEVPSPSSSSKNKGKGEEDVELRMIGRAYVEADKSSFTSFRREDDKRRILDLEEQFETKYGLKPKTLPAGGAAGAVAGADGDLPPLPFWDGGGGGTKSSSSAELLRMLPGGIGLEYDPSLRRYALAADTDFLRKYPAALQQQSGNGRPIGFLEYGPRGRNPIERNMELGPGAYLRFGLSGAICASGVHLLLTPLDVVKTKGQVNPARYPDVATSLRTVWNEEGPETLFSGWLPTYCGHFVAGGTLYAATEFVRRTLTEMATSSSAAVVDPSSLEVPIILIAAAIASSLNAVLICPFDAVRIRTVAQPDYAPDGTGSVGVLKRIVDEEGVRSLFDAVPVFLARNIPYAMVKFLVFDLSTQRLYGAYPAAREDLKLSLLVSLAGGVLGGISAAIVSNPADAVISELKKDETEASPVDAVNVMLERGGISAFFVGLPLRMAFYSINGSLTFVVYDAVRFLLGIGADDLKLYLDVLGGALADSPLV
mmetsp:Transcript_32251/g.96709  ORF Transcript_32251/g.96709 Transcript_32251/m.96709 type:complete len:641 (-) Transcript_32251:26-1948(-)